MDFEIRPHTILLTRGGSRSYGTHTPSSDLDIKGVAIPPKRYYFGCLNNFEQAEGKEHAAKFANLVPAEEIKNGIEGTVYELKKFIRLAREQNPTILDVLFCRDQDVLLSNKWGDLLRANRGIWLSKRAKHSFSGYASQQAEKMGRHRHWMLNKMEHPPTRADAGLPENYPKAKYDVVFDAIQKKVDSWRFNLTGLTAEDREHITWQVSHHLTETGITRDDEWVCAARALGLQDDLIGMLEKERKFRKQLDDWNAYQRWLKKRNPKRAALEDKFGIDLKNALHLVRLMRCGKELLLTGHYRVWRGDKDAEELKAILGGAWSYDQLMEFFRVEDAEMTRIYDSPECVLPHSPDVKAIDRLCMDILEEALV